MFNFLPKLRPQAFATMLFIKKMYNNFSETTAFSPKSGWKSPKGHASLEVFLSCVEKDLFSDEMNDSTRSNLFWEE